LVHPHTTSAKARAWGVMLLPPLSVITTVIVCMRNAGLHGCAGPDRITLIDRPVAVLRIGHGGSPDDRITG